MLKPGPLVLGIPLTHPDFIAATQRLAATGDLSGQVCVQARRNHRDGPYWLCGVVLVLHVGNVEMFKVRTAIDEFWATGRDLRLCSPNGRCFCDDGPAETQPEPEPARSTTGTIAKKTQQPCGFQPGCAVQPTGHPT